MPEDLAIINSESYDLGLQEIEEAKIIQQKIMDLTKERDEKLENAKENLLLGISAKIKELQNKLIFCNEQIFYYSNQIDKLSEEIELEKIGAEVQILSDSILKTRKKLDLWRNKKSEIERLLEKICAKYGHQIDLKEIPVGHEIRMIKDNTGYVSEYIVLKHYICKCCGKEILWNWNESKRLKDREWHNNMLNLKFTKRIVEEEVLFETPKLVLGKPKVILSDVNK